MKVLIKRRNLHWSGMSIVVITEASWRTKEYFNKQFDGLPRVMTFTMREMLRSLVL